MGLDQYAYSVEPDGSESEIDYWRKHNRLEGYMSDLYFAKKEMYKNAPIEDRFIDALDDDIPYKSEEFNCAKVYLTEEDLDDLENCIKHNKLETTEGCFFGGIYDYDNKRKKADLKFVKNARKELKKGNVVYYTSWW